MNPFRSLYSESKIETRGERLFFRIFEFVVVVYSARFAWQWGDYMRRMQDLPYSIGIGTYIDLTPLLDSHLPLVVAGGCTVLLISGYLRFKPGFSYATALFLLHILFAARHSLGKISHSGQLVGMALLGLAAGLLFFKTAREQRRFVIGFSCFSVGLAYTLAAFSKLVGSGPGWIDGQNLWLWIGEKTVDVYAATGVLAVNPVQEVALASYPLATAFLATGLAVEFFGFLFWWKRPRPWIATALIGMHLGIAITMHIFFNIFVVMLLLLGYPWPRLLDRLLTDSSSSPSESEPRVSSADDRMARRGL